MMHVVHACRAVCGWPGAPGTAMIITQTDELSGMRSARRAFSIVRVSTTHNGRAASMALVDTLNMAAVAAATSARALRDANWAIPEAPGLDATPETVGQIQAAAVVDAGARLVAVLTHVGVSAHAFVMHAPEAGGACRVTGAVLTEEDSLQVSLCSLLSSMNNHAHLWLIDSLRLGDWANRLLWSVLLRRLHCA